MSNQDRAAMQMALEALEETTALCINYESVEEKDGYQLTEAPKVIAQGKEAITALREALAQPQENKTDWSKIDYRPKVYVAQPQDHSEQHLNMVQGEWVDLTDEEIKQAAWGYFADSKNLDETMIYFAESVIAKLKEKNTPKVVQPAANVEQAWSEFHDWFEAGGETGWSVSDATHFRIMFGHGFHAALKCTTPPVVPQGEPVAWIGKEHLLCIKDGWQPVLSFKQLEDDVPLCIAKQPVAPNVEPVFLSYYDQVINEIIKSELLYLRGYTAAIEATKEKAAKVCDGYAANSSHPMNFAENCAAAIRSMK